MSESQLAAVARSMVAPGKGILASDVPVGGFVRGWWGPMRGGRTGEEAREAARDFQEMICRTPDLGEHLSSMIVVPYVLEREARDGTPLIELIAERGLLLGVTPTRGYQSLGGLSRETVPKGLDGLPERLEEWREKGARFVKWRVSARVAPGLPTPRAITANARSVAECAAMAKAAGLVTIVEPEVEMRGEHTIERQFEVTEWFLHRTFEALYEHGVAPEEIVLKTNMVVSGSDCPEQADRDTVARETLRCLRRAVPPAVPGIAFLSGGQSDLDAAAHLDAMNRADPQPWVLSFSYGRAIGRAALAVWDGKLDDPRAQAVIRHRARMNALATSGKWDEKLEVQVGEMAGNG